MMEGVGRRLGSRTGFLLNIGTHSLNGRERNVLFRNDSNGSPEHDAEGQAAVTFTEVGWVNGADRIEDGRGLATLDANQDGHVDLMLRNYRMPAGLLVNSPVEGRWIGFELEGVKSNRDAIGARILVRTGENWQLREVAAGSGYLSGNSLRQHFGIGDAARVDEVLIDWPSGERTRLVDLDVDRLHAITEGSHAAAVRDPR